MQKNNPAVDGHIVHVEKTETILLTRGKLVPEIKYDQIPAMTRHAIATMTDGTKERLDPDVPEIKTDTNETNIVRRGNSLINLEVEIDYQ